CIPKLVETHFATMRIACDVGLKMAERFVDQFAVIAWRKRFQERIGHIYVVEIARRFVRARCLRGCAHVATREQIGKGRMMLPESENRSKPAGSREKRVPLEVWTPPKKMVSATCALGIVPRGLLPGSQTCRLATRSDCFNPVG